MFISDKFEKEHVLAYGGKKMIQVTLSDNINLRFIYDFIINKLMILKNTIQIEILDPRIKTRVLSIS